MNDYKQTRRSLLALGATAAAASTAGCTDQLPFIGDGPLEFSAVPASVPETVLDETGYEEHEVEEVVTEETFEVGGRTQDVVVTNWQAEYDKAVDLGEFLPSDERVRAAVVTVLTTPQVDVLGRSFNPVADMESEELAEMVQDQFEQFDGMERVGEETLAVGGESTTVGEFEGEAVLAEGGGTIDLTLHIGEAVESGDDLVVAVGGYPTQLREQERSHVVSMFEAIDHGE